jgi:asparagine synthase (glutamine-hydrolysing)
VATVCGIVGKVDLDDRVDLNLVERMCESMKHRGPDSGGAFAEDGVALGVRRLAVIDLESGDQPIYSEDHSLVLVLNGEIYNYVELREDLVRAGHRFATRSDAEVVVHLYEEYGDACVDRLRGIFAFALWDRRTRRLLLARDRVGKKPLFYCRQGRRFWFSSELRTLLMDEEVPREVDPVAIDTYLHYRYVTHPNTIFSTVRRLSPGHVLSWRDGSVAIRRYWKLSYRDRFRDASDAELCELIRERLLEATRLRLRSDVPVGALLSGGVDSSSVVAAIARTTAGALKTFSIGFDVDEFDERSSSRAVARFYSTDHHELVLGPEAMEVLPQLVWHYGEPYADSSAIATFHLAKLARRHVTVALNGDGGDECFAGYDRYRSFAAMKNGSRSFPAEAYAERLASAGFTDADCATLYDPEFLNSLDERPWLSVVTEPYSESDADEVLDRVLDADVQHWLPDDLLVKMDVATMAHSLETRSPLLDHRFMELAAALPARLKIDGATTKRIFKDAVREWLPDGIADQPKWGFEVPLAHWFRGPLRHLPEDVLLDGRSLERGLFREERIRSLIDEHVDGTRDHSYRLWTLVALELWFRTYVDTAAVPSPLALSSSETAAP